MDMIPLTKDFREFLRLFGEKGVEYPPIMGCEDLIANKRAAGRMKDLADIEELER